MSVVLLTLAAPGERLDLALDADVPLRELRPELLARLRATASEPVVIARAGAEVLDADRTLRESGVLDGEVLVLRGHGRAGDDHCVGGGRGGALGPGNGAAFGWERGGALGGGRRAALGWERGGALGGGRRAALGWERGGALGGGRRPALGWGRGGALGWERGGALALPPRLGCAARLRLALAGAVAPGAGSALARLRTDWADTVYESRLRGAVTAARPPRPQTIAVVGGARQSDQTTVARLLVLALTQTLAAGEVTVLDPVPAEWARACTAADLIVSVRGGPEPNGEHDALAAIAIVCTGRRRVGGAGDARGEAIPLVLLPRRGGRRAARAVGSVAAPLAALPRSWRRASLELAALVTAGWSALA